MTDNEKEELKYNSRVKIIVAVLVTFVITFCGSIFLYDRYLSHNNLLVRDYESTGNLEEDLDKLRTELEANYYKDIDDKKLYEWALKGYVAGVGNEWTLLMTKEEYDSIKADLENFVGIGIEMREDPSTNKTTIVKPIKGTPAEEAGLQKGDIIIEVDLEDVTTKGSEYIASKIKGKEGTKVKVKVLRDKEKIEFDIKRAKVNAHKLEYDMLENNIGYIKFDSFTETCDEEFKQAYKELSDIGVKSLIVDLRGNSGGFVDSAENIADLFLDKKKVIYIEKGKNDVEKAKETKTAKEIDLPVVVLVNGESASASEILAGCLKDHKIATLVGTKTFGKGQIQRIIDNVLGKEMGAALRVTIAEYCTPNREEIDKKGIEPDVVVELEVEDEEEMTREEDTQLQKAIEILKNK